MPRKRRYCGFCGKSDDETERPMLAGPCIEVCAECVDTMYQMVHAPKPILPAKLATGKPRVVVPFRAR